MKTRGLARLAGVGVLLIAVVFISCGLCAQEAGITEAHKLFLQGNSAYKEGKYEMAVDSYEKAVSFGMESGNLYFNLGNSYFKKGDFGKAVFNYEKAMFFIPNDSDLKSNREYALSSLDIRAQFFGNRFERAAGRLFEGATIDFLTILLSGLYVVIIVVFIGSLFVEGEKRRMFPFLLVLIIIFLISAFALNRKIIYLEKGAIVIGKEADVRFEPLDGATTYFKLTEGNKVEVVEKSGNWYKIKRPDNKMGWVLKTQVASFSD